MMKFNRTLRSYNQTYTINQRTLPQTTKPNPTTITYKSPHTLNSVKIKIKPTYLAHLYHQPECYAATSRLDYTSHSTTPQGLKTAHDPSHHDYAHGAKPHTPPQKDPTPQSRRDNFTHGTDTTQNATYDLTQTRTQIQPTTGETPAHRALRRTTIHNCSRPV